jgi:hypothetical protein
MRRLTILAKGNLDVKNSLHSFFLGGKFVWNGINEIVRQRYPGTIVRLRHETWTCSDALLASTGVVPAELEMRHLPLGAYSRNHSLATRCFIRTAPQLFFRSNRT